MLQFLVLLSYLMMDPDTIPQQAVAARTRIVTGDLIYEVSFGSRPDPGGEIVWRPPSQRDRIVFDAREGWRAFQEHWTPFEPTFLKDGKSIVQRSPGGGSRRRVIMRPDFCYEYCPDLLSDGSKFAISERFPEDALWEKLLVIDPRKFGMTPQVLFDLSRIEIADYVRPQSMPELLIERDMFEGREVIRVDYVRAESRRIRYLLDPQRGMNVVQISEEGTHPDGSTFLVMNTSTLKHDKGADVWFPCQVLYTGTLNGKKPAQTYGRILITEAKWNCPIEPNQFEIAALQAHPHTSISSAGPHPDNSPSLEWTGEKVAPISGRPTLKSIPK